MGGGVVWKLITLDRKRGRGAQNWSWDTLTAPKRNKIFKQDMICDKMTAYSWIMYIDKYQLKNAQSGSDCWGVKSSKNPRNVCFLAQYIQWHSVQTFKL